MVIISIFAALACLQRYIGVTLVLTGAVSIAFLMKSVAFKQRVGYLVVFSTISLLPIAAWVIRNYILTSPLTGRRAPSSYSFSQSLGYTYDAVVSWFLPFDRAASTAGEVHFAISKGIGALSVLVLVSLIVILIRFPLSGKSNNKLVQLFPAVIFVVVYVLFLISGSSVAGLDRIGFRLLAPV